MSDDYRPTGGVIMRLRQAVRCRALGMLLCWMCVAMVAKGAEPFCVLLTVEGQVETAAKGSGVWRPAAANQVLNLGDQLRTRLRSRATLRWSDQSHLRVDELTEMQVLPPRSTRRKPQLNLKSGAAYLFSREAPGEIEIRTPVVSGAIRGTEFALTVAADGRTVLALLDGQVELENEAGKESFGSGEKGTVAPGQAPVRTALLNADAVIQWVLYYPSVVDSGELRLTAEEKEGYADSLQAYREGDTLQALARMPDQALSDSESEAILRAALMLAAGQLEAAESAMVRSAPLGRALWELTQTVRGEVPEVLAPVSSASALIARSYSLQARSELREALDSALKATKVSPDFGAAWVRVAELEFGFGRTAAARTALDRGLQLSPRHAQGLALRGFLQAAGGEIEEALVSFEEAIAIDGALGNAWLGRGLTRIRLGDAVAGREDLQVAATLEPQRSVLRSYLAKAFVHTGDRDHAEKELRLARDLDPNDPTPWLYSALFLQRGNRINEAASDLQQSQALNNNRSLFRSRLLLDQDQAVRGANLASIYRDLGMFEIGAQEASRAVNLDYANHSAHLFLANSFDALRDPKLINLRYENAWFSERLLASLLAPGGGSYSQTISQQEYSRMFDSRHFGVFSSTEYLSNGDWIQRGSHHGILGDFSYSVDGSYRWQNGYRPNNDLEQLEVGGRVKYQVTPQDSVYLEAWHLDQEAGDVVQYYSQTNANLTRRVTEEQTPNLLAGYHREWGPGSHTLFLFGRFDDELKLSQGDPAVRFLRTLQPFGSPTPNPPSFPRQSPAFFSEEFERSLELYSAELQQIWQTAGQALIVGGRYQLGWADAVSSLVRQPPLGASTQIPTQAEASLDRAGVYAYQSLRFTDDLQLTAGLAYDRLHYPENVDTAPISTGEKHTDQFSPKAGLLWSPFEHTHLRVAFTRSLGGAFFDNSVRLEPTQVAGFNQAYRSLAPESAAGLVPGNRFETLSLGLDRFFPRTRTFFLVELEKLNSEGSRTIGIVTNSNLAFPVADSASSTKQDLDYEEKSLLVTFHQLLGNEFAAGARYRLTDANLETRHPDLPLGVPAQERNQEDQAYLHQVTLYGIYQHRCGFFSQINAIWSQQANRGISSGLPGDDFWHYNLAFGYRMFQRRLEATVGLLNLTDRDYQLNPLTLYSELPRERTLIASLKWYF